MAQASWLKNMALSIPAACKGLLGGALRGGIIGTVTALIVNTVLTATSGTAQTLPWEMVAMLFGVSDALLTGATKGYKTFQSLQRGKSALAEPVRALQQQRGKSQNNEITFSPETPSSYVPVLNSPDTEQLLSAQHEGVLMANKEALQKIH